MVYKPSSLWQFVIAAQCIKAFSKAVTNTTRVIYSKLFAKINPLFIGRRSTERSRSSMSHLTYPEKRRKPGHSEKLASLFLALSPGSQDLDVRGPGLFPALAVLQDRGTIKPRPQKFVEKQPETKVHSLNCFFLHSRLTINLRPNKDFVFFVWGFPLLWWHTCFSPPQLPAHLGKYYQAIDSLWKFTSTRGSMLGDREGKKGKQNLQPHSASLLFAVQYVAVQRPHQHDFLEADGSAEPTGSPLRVASHTWIPQESD